MPYRIEYQKDHKNVKGEPAPWVIINADRNEIVVVRRQKKPLKPVFEHVLRASMADSKLGSVERN